MTMAERAAYFIREFGKYMSFESDEDCFWHGVIAVWPCPWEFSRKGERVTVQDLNRALMELDVQEFEISKPGAYTFLELDNIAFVYRDRPFKCGMKLLEISPHIKGKPFRKCFHSFFCFKGSALAIAQFLIDFDREIPEMKAACIAANPY